LAGGRGPERRQKGRRPVWESERAIRPWRPGNAGGGGEDDLCQVLPVEESLATQTEFVKHRNSLKQNRHEQNSPYLHLLAFKIVFDV